MTADMEKRASYSADAPEKKNIQELEMADQENAVGYREYLEALDIEVSDREVRTQTETPGNF